MADRALLERVDFASQTLTVDGVEYRMCDCELPHGGPAGPLAPHRGRAGRDGKAAPELLRERAPAKAHPLSVREGQRVPRGQRHAFVPRGHPPWTRPARSPRSPSTGKPTAAARGWTTAKRWRARAILQPEGSEERRKGQDFLWYLWCGAPFADLRARQNGLVRKVFHRRRGRVRRAEKPLLRAHRKRGRGRGRARAMRIFEEFGLSPEQRATSSTAMCPCARRAARSPSRAGGKLIVIDGGFCKAYQAKRASRATRWWRPRAGSACAAHSPFESTAEGHRRKPGHPCPP